MRRTMTRYVRAFAQDASHATICLVEVAGLWWRNERPAGMNRLARALGRYRA